MTAALLWFTWCATALVTAAWLTRRLIDWTAARGILDIPNSRSSHTRATPRGGGLAIVVLVATAAVVTVVLRPEAWARLAGAVAPALAVAAVSWLDDIRSLSNRTRFLVHVGAAVAATWALGPVFRVDLGIFGSWRLGLLAWPLTIVWVVGLTNAFNFMDGIDGIAGITAAAAGLAVAAAAAACGDGPVAVTAATLAGAAFGFLTCNWQPARIFMGDVGSAFCGCILATLPIAGRPDCVPELVPVAVAALWPFIFDTSFTLLRRAWRGENVFRSHRSHLYQRLHLAGWTHRAVAGLYGGLAAGAGGAAAAALLEPAALAAADLIALAWSLAVPVLLLALVAAAERRAPRVAA